MNKEKNKKSLVEQHALNRLNEVEKEQRKEYDKRPSDFSWSKVIMVGILLIVLATMMMTLFR